MKLVLGAVLLFLIVGGGLVFAVRGGFIGGTQESSAASEETTQNVLMPAHVVAGVTQDMKLFRDESFGPVVGVIRARDEAHAIELANDTEYGLSAAVFTRDTARGLRVARQIKSGICHVNGPTVHDEAQMPFGGVGASGYGRFGGKAGIDSFTELRWITMETQPGHFPI